MTENEEFLYRNFLISIKSGFESVEDIIENTMESVEDEGWGNEIPKDWVEKTIRLKYAQHEEKSRTWQHPTDTEKLHSAFDSLCKQKVIALHNAGYEKSDAVYYASDVWKDLEDEGVKPIGYCYYHGQDLERVIEDGHLNIGFYGEKDKNDKEAIIIGHKVLNALKEAGLKSEWDGTASKRIKIENFDWQNIFTSDDDVEELWGYDRIVEIMTKL